jgi:hypothetical protein
VAAARCSSGGAVHLDLTGLSICTVLGTDIRSSVDITTPVRYLLKIHRISLKEDENSEINNIITFSPTLLITVIIIITL